MAVAKKRDVRYTKAAVSKKIKPGGRTVVSEALVKSGASNMIPKLHVKRGDMVMLIKGSEKVGKGRTGKVLSVHPSIGKITVEGINLITRATKQKTAMGKSGLIKKEGPIFASRVMLFCTSCKKPTRVRHKMLDNGKKTRICTHCSEAFDA
jgi:large subunit ribosomal protein L24